MTDQSHITVILDRTGSMDSIRDDVIGGFNAFLAEQQSASTATTWRRSLASRAPWSPA